MQFRRWVLWTGLVLVSFQVQALEIDAVMARLAGTFISEPNLAHAKHQKAVHAEVRVAPLRGRGLFMQWHDESEGDEPGELTRQRLWSLTEDEEGLALRFFTFRDHRPFIDLHEKPIVAMALSDSDLRAYPEGCTLRLSAVDGRFEGAVTAERCRFDTEPGRTLAFEYSLALTEDGFEFHEAAFEDDGTLAFRIPEAGVYHFRRR